MPAPPSTRTTERRKRSQGDNRVHGVSFDPLLADDRTIVSATATIVLESDGTTTTDLVAEDVAPNANAYTDQDDNGRTVPANRGVLLRLSEGTRGVAYLVRILATLDGDDDDAVELTLPVDVD